MDIAESVIYDDRSVGSIFESFKFDVEYFPVYLLSGQLIFNFYSEVTTCSMSAIIDNGPLIKRYMYQNICSFWQEHFQVP